MAIFLYIYIIFINLCNFYTILKDISIFYEEKFSKYKINLYLNIFVLKFL